MSFKLKPYTNKELYNLYGVSKDVFKSWICDFKEEIGKVKGKTYTIKQVKIIIKYLGAPDELSE